MYATLNVWGKIKKSHTTLLALKTKKKYLPSRCMSGYRSIPRWRQSPRRNTKVHRDQIQASGSNSRLRLKRHPAAWRMWRHVCEGSESPRLDTLDRNWYGSAYLRSCLHFGSKCTLKKTNKTLVRFWIISVRRACDTVMFVLGIFRLLWCLVKLGTASGRSHLGAHWDYWKKGRGISLVLSFYRSVMWWKSNGRMLWTVIRSRVSFVKLFILDWLNWVKVGFARMAWPGASWRLPLDHLVLSFRSTLSNNNTFKK